MSVPTSEASGGGHWSAEGGAPTGPGRPQAKGKRVLALLRSRVVRRGFMLLVLALLAYAVVDQWGRIGDSITQLSAPTLVGAELLVLGGLGAALMSWRALLADLGSPLSPTAAVKIFLLGQLGKYLPGSLWPVLAQMELGVEYHVPRPRSATAAVVQWAVQLVTGALVGVAALPFVAGNGDARAWSLAVLPVGLVLLHPRVLNPLLSRGLRLAKRAQLEHPLSIRGLLTCGSWSVLGWAFLGMHVYLLAHGLRGHGGDGRHLIALAIGGYALAWVAGFLVVLAPAGAGVREGVMTVILAVPIGRPAALTVAVLSRLLLTVGDVIGGMLAAGLLGRRRLAQLRHRERDAVDAGAAAAADAEAEIERSPYTGQDAEAGHAAPYAGPDADRSGERAPR